MNQVKNIQPKWFVLFEVLVVLFSVVFGLILNELRIEHVNKKRADIALKNIIREMKTNLSNIESSNLHHITVRDSLEYLLNSQKRNPGKISINELGMLMNGGFGVPSIQNYSWNLAKNLGSIEFMDYKTATILSRVYDLQDFYMKKYDKLSENFYIANNMELKKREGLVLSLHLLASDVVITESNLKNMYSKALEILEDAE
ncbi:MAG: hypothetical protein U9P73_00685 [Candidatus Cloacimonadota bacterium]|nr:hypothetical protein [Candidatus Cloacimonadota bacterium]